MQPLDFHYPQNQLFNYDECFDNTSFSLNGHTTSISDKNLNRASHNIHSCSLSTTTSENHLSNITYTIPTTFSTSEDSFYTPATSLSPLTSHSTPVTAHSAPATSLSRPVTAHSTPATSHSTPATSHSTPATSHSTPATAHSTPTTSHSTPATSHSTPATSQSTPTTSRYTPTASGPASNSLRKIEKSVFYRIINLPTYSEVLYDFLSGKIESALERKQMELLFRDETIRFLE